MKFFTFIVASFFFIACSTSSTQQKPNSVAASAAASPAQTPAQVAVKPVSIKELEKLSKEQAATPEKKSAKKETELESQAAQPAASISADNYKITPDIDLNEWKQIGSDKGVQTYQKKKDLEGLVAFRGETIIPTSLVRIAAVFDDASIRKDWIEALVVGKVLSTPNRLHRIEYNHTAVPWPFHDRDFVYDVKVQIARNPSTMILTMKSADDSLAPITDGIVRGKLVYCYYHMKEIEPGKSTHVVVELVVDPMGNIPKWLVNASSRKWPENTLANLSKVSQRDNLVIPSDLEQYYSGGKK